MINIGPLYPLVTTPRTYKSASHDEVAAGTAVNKDAQYLSAQRESRRRRNNKDRRQRNLKPLIDLRVGRDRRDDPAIPSIDIDV